MSKRYVTVHNRIMNGKRKEAPPTSLQFELAGGSNFLRIDLDAILHNVRIMRSKCSPHTGLIHSVTQSFIGLSWTSFYTKHRIRVSIT